MSKREARKWEKELKKKPWLANPHQVYIANDIAYVVARDGDTFQFLGKEFDISWRKLVKYNDLHKRVYLRGRRHHLSERQAQESRQTSYRLYCKRRRFHALHFAEVRHPPEESV